MAEERRPFLVFGAPLIMEEEIDEVVATLRSGWIGTGPKTASFEQRFAAYKGVDYAAAVSSCTAALHLSLLVAGVGAGDEVITTSLTFSATVNAIIHCGAIPVLADIDPATMNIDPREVERRITPRTKAIVPVHFAGRACQMDRLIQIANEHGLKMIEDCAHAIETEYKGRKAGTFGDFGCFSFYVTKNVITGEGGMVLARTRCDIERIRALALHGMSKDAWKRYSDEGYQHYRIVEAGYKANMTDLQASLGIHQLARVEDSWLRRQRLWQLYNDGLKGLPLKLPAEPEADTRHAYHLYTVLVSKDEAGIGRDQLLGELTKKRIGVGVHYLSIPEHPFYQAAYGWQPGDYPHARTVGSQTVSLPLSPKMTDEDAQRVIETLWEIFQS